MPNLADLNHHHTVLQAAVREFIQRHGWHVLEVVYHHEGVGDTSLLQRAGDPTALYVRTLPDMVITNGQKALLLEVKTNISTRYANATPELFPIIAARSLWNDLRVQTLYIYENLHAGISAAWLAHQVFRDVRVSAIYIGTQRPDWKRSLDRIRDWQDSGIIPRDIKIVTASTGGSGDPYVVISENQLRNLPTWQEVLERVLCG